MRDFAIVAGAVLGCLTSSALLADPAMQPPMNTFNFAFYDCANGAFQISYDSDAPKTATLTTSDGNKAYALDRTAAPSGVAFSHGPTRFWTDGKTVRIEGTSKALKDCKIKRN